MPIYTFKCQKCEHQEDMFFGQLVDKATVNSKCSKCGHNTLTKVRTPINSANFSESSSKRSLKTRTGVGELQLAHGAKKVIDEGNKRSS